MSLYVVLYPVLIHTKREDLNANRRTNLCRYMHLLLVITLMLATTIYALGGTVFAVTGLSTYYDRNATLNNATVNGSVIVCNDYVHPIYQMWLLPFSILNLLYVSEIILLGLSNCLNVGNQEKMHDAIVQGMMSVLPIMEFFSLGWVSYGLHTYVTSSNFQYCDSVAWKVFHDYVIFAFTLLLSIIVLSLGLLVLDGFLYERYKRIAKISRQEARRVRGVSLEFNMMPNDEDVLTEPDLGIWQDPRFSRHITYQQTVEFYGLEPWDAFTKEHPIGGEGWDETKHQNLITMLALEHDWYLQPDQIQEKVLMTVRRIDAGEVPGTQLVKV